MRLTIVGTDLTAYDVQWSPDGLALAVMDKDRFCMLYEPDSDHVSKGWEHAREGLTHVSEQNGEISLMSIALRTPLMA